MKISVFPDYCSIAGRPVLDAFVESLDETVTMNDMDADVAVIWSVLWNGRMAANQKVWEHYRSQRKPVVVLEVGCLKRNHTWKVAVNGVNREANFGNSTFDKKRIGALGLSLKPWRRHGNHIIVCGQHGDSEQWRGMPPVGDWMVDICQQIRKRSSKRIILRPHPRFPVTVPTDLFNVEVSTPVKIGGTYDDFDFETLLTDAFAVVSYNSGPATVAAMSGVPVFTHHSSLAYEVAQDITRMDIIDSPRYHDRTEWLQRLSYTEWTVDEIRAGIPWSRIKSVL